MFDCGLTGLWTDIKDPVPLIEKSRASCPGGRFPHRFIQVIIITGLTKLSFYVESLRPMSMV